MCMELDGELDGSREDFACNNHITLHSELGEASYRTKKCNGRLAINPKPCSSRVTDSMLNSDGGDSEGN